MACYLKSLDLQGFKSFGSKTRIEFAEGITGIVGPNGCGKSNVVEAVKWVLGEQSAKSLRGDKMQDIIFNGTSHRSPSGMAEAVLTFNNEQNWLPLEYPEISISRRLFRSGEGQYYINGARSRLKDNIELFLDTGIGRDSYAIFEQGKIDRLLSESAEDRRTLFEDFAGISKFKFRKEEAEKKLAMARENLERIQETIDRLEREIAALELQAQDAEVYKTTSALLNEAELKFGAVRLQNMQKEIEKRQKECEALRNALIPLTEELTRIENEASKSEAGAGEREYAFGKLNERFHTLEKELDQAKVRRESAQRNLKDNESRLTEIEIRSKQDRERFEEGEEELADKRDTVFDAEKRETAARELLAKAEDLHDGIKAETNALENALLARSRELGYPRAVTRGDSDQVNKTIAEHQGRVWQYSAEEISQGDIFKTKTVSIAREEKELFRFEKSYREASAEADSRSNEKNARAWEISVKEQAVKEWEARQKSLLEESKSFDKKIMAALEQSLEQIRLFNKTRPVLAEAVQKSFSEIENAVHRGNPVDADMVRRLKTALDENEAAYTAFSDSLFGEDFTAKLSLLDQSDALWASLEAERAALETLKSSLAAFIEKEVSAFAVRAKAENDFKNSDRELKKLQSEAEQAHMAADRAKSDHFNARQDLDRAEAKRAALEEAIRLYDEGHAALRERRNQVQEEVSEARGSFKGLEAQAGALRGEIRSMESRLDDLRRSLNNADKDKQSLQQSDLRLKEEIEELFSVEDELKPELERLQKEMSAAAAEIQDLSKVKKALEAMRQDALAKFNKLRMRESEIEGGLSERLQTFDAARESLKEQFHLKEISVALSEEDTLEKLQVKIKSLKDKLYKMGDVNMMAVEQYHAAQDRHQELSHQKQDIEDAAADTEALITETNAESSEKFMKAFDDIRKSFRELFAQLFDGGRADLILLDKDQPLSSGIDIMAEPPGQKFQSVSLLSGGQRAMVAIAVIFSMLKLKPTPFIILDEMDAPLDDENIERFKNLLSRFKDMGQFVIVSHSKSTLEVCDALFGVTMEELGCSKVLSVAFDEADDLIFQ